MKIKKEQWEKETLYEKNWWGSCSNTFEEEKKQFIYASYMGLDKYNVNHPTKKEKVFDLKGKSILDIGGGPISLLLKCVNFSRAVVIDPCDYPDWIEARYKAHNIELIKKPAEEIDIKDFDEVWIYNVLQHTIDPDKIIKNIKAAGKVVRLFEWIDTKINPGHPHSFTKEFYDKHFDSKGNVVKIVYPGEEGKYYNPAYYVTYANKIEKEEPEKKVQKEVKFIRAKKKRFHLLGLAHLPTNKIGSNLGCAYSQKVVKMAKMLKSSGHTVYFYGVEGSNVECDEFIQVSTKEILRQTYGDYDKSRKMFKHHPKDLASRTFNENAIKEINKRKKERDYLLIPFGNYQKAVVDGVGLMLSVEMGIGYTGVFAPFKVFESYAWMHHVYGLSNKRNISYYDCVIPNYFEPSDFKYNAKKKDYFIYLGRVIPRKGVGIIKGIAEATNIKLVIAGQLGEGPDYINIDSPNIEYVGFADLKKRKELLANAKGLFLPTIYIEPFGGTSIEAAFSGTPVITTDCGVFTETVLDGVTGYRCRTTNDFIHAVKNIDKINPEDCRNWAMKNFTMDRVAQMYEHYFNELETLFDKGWYQESNYNKEHYKWLRKYYPKGVYH